MYIKDYIQSFQTQLNQHLQFYKDLLREVVRPLMEFQKASGKCDDPFLPKVWAEEVTLEDVLATIPPNNEPCERLKLGIQIASLLRGRELEPSLLEALCELQPIQDLKNIKQQLSK